MDRSDGFYVAEDRKTSENQQRVFSLVDDLLIQSGMGLNKELAKSQASQLVESVKSVEFKEPGLDDNVFGRKLVTRVLDVYTFPMGNILAELVNSNYPSTRFAEIQREAVSRLEEKIEETERRLKKEMPSKPKDKDYYSAKARIDWNTFVSQVKDETEEYERQVREAGWTTKGKKPSGKNVKVEPMQEEHVPIPRKPDMIDISERAREAFYTSYEYTYINDCELYADFDKRKASLEDEKKSLRKDIERYITVNIIVDSVRSTIVLLVNKIKGCLNAYPIIVTKLTATTCLEMTGELITNPYESSNLAGIIQLLKKEYHTANLARFNRDFSDLLTCKVTAAKLAENPLLASQQTDKRIAEWVSLNSWAFMTPDIFFTNILLGYLTNDQFKQKCVAEVIDFVNKIDSGDVKDTASVTSATVGFGSMPIYQHLVQFMKTQFESANYLSITGKHSAQPNANVNTNATRNPPAPQRRFGLHTAAAATATSASKEFATGPFSNEVNRASKTLWCKDVQAGIEYPYVAMKEKCAQCHGKTAGDTKVEMHSPRCFGGVCNRCNMYGHKQYNCLQAVVKK